jgi:uncharacterized phage protein (predicted DNA packaging)
MMLEVIKEYLRIDGDEENTFLSLLLVSAKTYLKNAGVSEPSDLTVPTTGDDPNALYKLVLMMMITHWYENRMVVTAATARAGQAPIPYGVESIILQLKADQLPEVIVESDVV